MSSPVPDPGFFPHTAAPVTSPASLTRRPSPFTYVTGLVMALVGAAFLVGSRLFFRGMPSDPISDPVFAGFTAVFTVLPVAFIVVGLAPLGQRTVFDASGIHSRSVLRREDLPWPDTRSAFSVSVSGGGWHTTHDGKSVKETATATVEVVTADRSVTLAAPRITAFSTDGLRARLEAEVDEIWAWALACGYTREAAPLHGGVPAAPAQAGAAPSGATVPGPVLADQSLLTREPLVLRGRPDSWLLVVVTVAWLVLAGGAALLPSLRSGLRSTVPFGRLLTEGSSSLPGGMWFPVLCCVAYLLVTAYKVARRRLTVTRQGLVWADEWQTRHLEWPTSRSCVFVVASTSSGRTVARVRLLEPGGTTLPVPGLVWSARSERGALLPAARAAESIWAWGAMRGVARDDGIYHPAADAGEERDRVATARRLAYLMSQPGAAG